MVSLSSSCSQVSPWDDSPFRNGGLSGSRRQPANLDSLQVTTGIDGASIGAQDFGSLLDLCDNLSPGLKKKTPCSKKVSLYYGAVQKLEQAFQTKASLTFHLASQEHEELLTLCGCGVGPESGDEPGPPARRSHQLIRKESAK